MKVCVVGLGNIGSVLANDFSQYSDIETVVLVRDSSLVQEQVNKLINHEIIQGNSIYVYDTPSEAFKDCDYIFFTLPSNVLHDKRDNYFDFIESRTTVVFVPGTGGMEFIVEPLVKRNIKIVGFQRVHAIARLVNYGELVEELDRKKELRIGYINVTENEKKEIKRFIENRLLLPVINLPNYLCVSLTPSNPILHTTRIYEMFQGKENHTFSEMVYFYKEWNFKSSEYLLNADKEFDLLIKKLKKCNIEIEGINNLKVHYGEDTVSGMTNKITSIQSLKDITSPIVKENNLFKIDKKSRYFIEDFEYGLSFLVVYSEYFKTNNTFFREMFDWYKEIADKSIDLDVYINQVNEVLDMINI